MEIKLTQLAAILGRCWKAAEEKTATLVTKKYPAPNEENLIFLFSGELREEVEQASAARHIEFAFLQDLRSSLWNLPCHVASDVLGLIARVTFHGRWHEGHRSGADVGLVITRPLVELSSDHLRVEFRRDHGTGLVAQAKLGCPVETGKARLTWNKLTAPQVRKFPERRDYYSLLLYRLLGPTRSELQAFGWQLCKGHTSAVVQQWLESDAFPKELCSTDVLAGLFDRGIGTEDPKILRSIIDPTRPRAHAIELQITWPGRAGPPKSVSLQQEQQKQHVRQYL